MDGQVTMSEALVVTLVSMFVVFVVLVLISLLIGLLKTMSQENTKKVPEPPKKEELKPDLITTDKAEETEEELIAVITAAIAASLGLNIPDINISSIRRTNQNTNIWREVSKQEHQKQQLHKQVKVKK
jgi:sodium pump decarboxylase gamma subunit